MHLDQAVVVRRGAVDDDEDEVVVVVDLRALAEVLGVLDRERVELEDVAEDLEVARVGLVEVEPEEAAVGEQLLDRLAAELDLAAALARGRRGRPTTRLDPPSASLRLGRPPPRDRTTHNGHDKRRTCATQGALA